MIASIQDCLNRIGIRNWRITETHTHCAEMYFIRKQLDMPRIRNMTLYTVEVYRDFNEGEQKYRGMGNALISTGMSEEETERRIRSAYLAAGYVKNPWFELPDPIAAPSVPSASPLAAAAPEETAVRVAETMFSADTAEDAFLNSVEIFVSHVSVRMLGSNGLDVGYEKDRIKGELVAQCLKPQDVEQYSSFGWTVFDADAIREKVSEAIANVRARACATEAPASGTYSVLLTGEQIGTLLEYYGSRSHASLIWPGYSQWHTGMAVQGEKIEGEKLQLTLVPDVPYSSEGILMPERELLKDGELKLIHGSVRFCRYLGVEPTGDYDKIRCGNGSIPLEEMREEGVLEPVTFSDFQMDIMDGHFKGEIRLAYLHHQDGSAEKLTGGSINGALGDLQGLMKFSVERYEDLSYEGPKAVLIPGVAVAGK